MDDEDKAELYNVLQDRHFKRGVGWGGSADEAERPDINEFLKEIIQVCEKHGLSISHEDCHGTFRINRFNYSDALWLYYATDDR